MTGEPDARGVSLGVETAKGLLAKFGMAFVGFGGTLVFANLLQPNEYGKFFILFSVVKIVELPVVGWADAAKKRFSEFGSKQRAIFGGQLVFFTVWSIVASTAAFTFSDFLVTYTQLQNSFVLFILLLTAESLFISLQKLIEASGRMGAATWTDAIRSFITFPAQLALILHGWGPSGMAYGLSFATFLSLPLAWYYIGTKPQVPTWTALRRQWEYARYSTVATFFGRVYERFDTVLLGVLIGPSAAGLYEVAMKLATPASFVSEIASAGLMARISELHSRGQEFAIDVKNVLSFASVLAIPLFFGALAMPRDIVVVLFQPAYAEAAPLLIGLTLFQVIRSQSMVLSQTVYGLNRPDKSVRYSALAVGINVVLGVVLTVSVGPIGVVVATVVAEIVSLILYSQFLSQSFSIAYLLSRTLVEQVLVGGIMLATVLASRVLIDTDTVAGLSVGITIGATVYFVLLYALSDPFRATISGVYRDLSST